ncbi:MAG: hypothetical protein H6971_10425 [Gammaproteobacteria bacterium]|nr:hypothetical protein [Gammaproteobacteria bacterium]
MRAISALVALAALPALAEVGPTELPRQPHAHLSTEAGDNSPCPVEKR